MKSKVLVTQTIQEIFETDAETEDEAIQKTRDKLDECCCDTSCIDLDVIDTEEEGTENDTIKGSRLKIREIQNRKDISFGEYRKLDGINFHTILDFHRDPILFDAIERGIIQKPEPDSDALRFGTQFHQLELQGLEEFEKHNAIFPPPKNERTGKAYGSDTKAYQEAMKEFEKHNAGKAACTQEEFDLMVKMQVSIHSNECAAEKLHGAEPEEIESELVIAGETDFLEGWTLKGSIDRYDERWGIVDLKTCDALDDFTGYPKFKKNLKYNGYIEQLAFYQILFKFIADGRDTRNYPDCYIIAVEKKAPNKSAAFYFTDETMERARDNVTQWLNDYLDYRISGTLNSKYSDTITI